MMLGVRAKAQYHSHEFAMNPGDCLFVYTDGVPEADNALHEMFGEERLVDTLNQDPGAKPGELIRRVHEAFDLFAGGAPQFDDITMLCLEYYGRTKLRCGRYFAKKPVDTEFFFKKPVDIDM